MDWDFRRPRAITTTRSDLGTLKAAFRRVGQVRPLALWALALPVIGASIGLAFAITPLAAVVPVLALACGLAAWRYRNPEWLAVYEHGVVYANGPYILPARWDG